MISFIRLAQVQTVTLLQSVVISGPAVSTSGFHLTFFLTWSFSQSFKAPRLLPNDILIQFVYFYLMFGTARFSVFRSVTAMYTDSVESKR